VAQLAGQQAQEALRALQPLEEVEAQQALLEQAQAALVVKLAEQGLAQGLGVLAQGLA